jgi:tetratricopeptide (TPR) repeat protein
MRPCCGTTSAFAQAGLKNYDDAIASYKKAIDLETASKKPRMPVIGAANEGLGEIYARTGKVPEANAAFDAAAKADPANAPLFLRNEAVIFYQENNNAAEAAAADEGHQDRPTQPISVLHQGPGFDRECHDRSQDQPHRSAARLRSGISKVP